MGNPSLFLRFLRNPVRVGALCPSSPALCRMLVRRTGIRDAGVIVELGPGTGVVTREIVARANIGARVLAIELDARMCANLQQQFPKVLVCNESAAGLGDILRREGLPPADLVVSGLPWSGFPEELQQSILKPLLENLREGGVFTTFAYLHAANLPGGRRFRALLRSCFSRVEITPVVWKNLPPAFVYRCTR